MRNFNNENMSGRSMIEMLGVLAIIGVLSVGGIAGYSKAMMRYRTNKTIEQITQIVGNVHTFFAPQKSYNGIYSKDVQQKAKLIPEEMWESGKDYPQSIWGGTVSLEDYCFTDDEIETGLCKGFRLYLYNLPKEACIEIVSHDWSALDLVAMEVGDSDGSIGYDCYQTKESWEDDDVIYGCIYDNTLPISVERAVIGCGENASLPIVFFFK